MNNNLGLAAQREAIADVSRRIAGGDRRYQSALERYLAAVGGADAAGGAGGPRGADADERAPERAADGSAAPAPPRPAPWTHTLVRDVMTPNVVMVDEAATFKQIARALAANRVSAVPVVDDLGRVLGVVSESDLLAKITTAGPANPRLGGWRQERNRLRRKARGETAGDLMSAPAITVALTAPVIEAAQIAARAHVRRVPVVDMGGRIAGIVARSDLLRVFLSGDTEIRDYLTDVVLARRLRTRQAPVFVDVADGVVRLRGRLEERSMLEPLLAEMRGIAGVVAVHDELNYDVEFPPVPPPMD